MSKLGVLLPVLAVLVVLTLIWPAAVRAAGLDLPPAATQGLNLLYSGQSAKAMEEFRAMEAARPDQPLGYLLEAEARWWQIYCETCQIKWNMIDAWPQPRRAVDDSYLSLADQVTSLAEAHIAKGDSAEMELYAGLGWLLRARLLALRNQRLATARAGVNARNRFLRCLALDPQMDDAYTGLGIYNYFVDTLSTIAKTLRFFMGIPGGHKEDGIRQLRIAMQRGVLTRVTARFYLAKNLRTFDQDYSGSIEVMQPLVAEFPQNPMFHLILGDTEAKLNHKELAEASYRAAANIPVPDGACAERIRDLVKEGLAEFVEATRSDR